jgi:hypothetical protein
MSFKRCNYCQNWFKGDLRKKIEYCEECDDLRNAKTDKDNLLDSLLIEIEKLKKDTTQFGYQGILMGLNAPQGNTHYNQALSDITKIIEEKMK